MDNIDNSLQRIGTKKSQKTAENKKFFAVGVIIVIFAVIGFVCLIGGLVYSVFQFTDSDSKNNEYASFLVPVVSVDPDTFDDIEKADKNELLNIAIQSIIKDDNSPDKYAYSDGYMNVPESDVESVFRKYFGSDITVEHQNVEGYGFTFTYDKTNKIYKIPVTAISPVYTPQIENVKKSDSSIEIITGMIYAEKYEQADDGSMTVPEPDKYLKITLLNKNGAYYINAIQNYE